MSTVLPVPITNVLSNTRSPQSTPKSIVPPAATALRRDEKSHVVSTVGDAASAFTVLRALAAKMAAAPRPINAL
jgi:hypothetical protein